MCAEADDETKVVVVGEVYYAVNPVVCDGGSGGEGGVDGVNVSDVDCEVAVSGAERTRVFVNGYCHCWTWVHGLSM